MRYLSACVLVTLILLNKGPKVQVMLAIQICQRSHKVLPLSEKVKVRNLIRREKSCMPKLLRAAGENESSIREIVKQEREVCTSFAVTLETAKVTASVHDIGLLKMGKALNLYNKIVERKRPLSLVLLEYTVIIVIFLVIVNLLVCLIYKLTLS